MWSFFKWLRREKKPETTLPSKEVIGLRYQERPLLRREDLERMEATHRGLKDLISSVREEAASLNRALSTELEQTRRKMHVFMESTFDAVLILDHTGAVIDVNGRAEKLFRQPKDELLGRTIESFQQELVLLCSQLSAEAASYIAYRERMSGRFHDLADIYDRFVEYSLILRRVHAVECRSRVLDSLKLDVKIDIFNLDASEAVKVFYLLVCKDVTQVHDTLNRIETLNQLQRGILQSVPNPIFYKNSDGLYIGANEAFHNMFGTSNTTFSMSKNEDLFSPDTSNILDSIERGLNKLDSSDVSVEQVMLETRDSQLVYQGMLYCTSLRSSEGVYNGMIGTFVNFKFEPVDRLDVVGAIPSPSYVVNTNGTFLSCNSQFADLVGIPIEHIVGRSLDNLYDVPPHVTLDDLFDVLLPKSDMCEGHCYNQTTGLTINVVTYRRPFKNDAVSGSLCVVLDVTEIKNIQRIHQHIFEATPIPMYMKDSALRFVQVNQPYADWLGLPKHRILDRTILELKTLYDEGQEITEEQKAFYDKYQVMIEAIAKDISVHDQEIREAGEGHVQSFEIDLPHFGKLAVVGALMYRIPVFKEGVFDGVIGSVVDVSQFKEFRQSLANTLKVPTVLVDSANMVREFNIQYAAMLKTDPDYLLGQPFRPLPGAIPENTNVGATTKEIELDGVRYIRYSAKTHTGLTAHMYFVVD